MYILRGGVLTFYLLVFDRKFIGFSKTIYFMFKGMRRDVIVVVDKYSNNIIHHVKR